MEQFIGTKVKKGIVSGLFDKYDTLLDNTDPIRSKGEVDRIQGLLIECTGPICQIGEVCVFNLLDGSTVLAEVIGFSGTKVQMMALTNANGILPGTSVFSTGSVLRILVGEGLKGRILDGIGMPMDGSNLNFFEDQVPVFAEPPDVLKRERINKQLLVGIKAIDGMLSVGMGQRMGIFSGSGVGKSTLLGMIARNTEADVNVIALIGERGREVREFIENNLGEEGLKKSILVVASSDAPPMAKVRSAYTATTIAEYFRDKGQNVLLMVDSVTRLAMAQREISSALGEPPTTRGYSPSVFTMLPKILERAGTGITGSITAFYNVLVEGDDTDEPISDAIRGILDGHILLSRSLANRNHYPPIDVQGSISRLMIDVVSSAQDKVTREIKEMVAAYNEVSDLLNIGAYIKGSNPRADKAIDKIAVIETFLKQGIKENFTREEILIELYSIIHGRATSQEMVNKELGGQDTSGEDEKEDQERAKLLKTFRSDKAE